MACTACDDSGWIRAEHPAAKRFRRQQAGLQLRCRRHAVPQLQ